MGLLTSQSSWAPTGAFERGSRPRRRVLKAGLSVAASQYSHGGWSPTALQRASSPVMDQLPVAMKGPNVLVFLGTSDLYRKPGRRSVGLHESGDPTATDRLGKRSATRHLSWALPLSRSPS